MERARGRVGWLDSIFGICIPAPPRVEDFPYTISCIFGRKPQLDIQCSAGFGS
jgi:hypothetical protein